MITLNSPNTCWSCRKPITCGKDRAFGEIPYGDIFCHKWCIETVCQHVCPKGEIAFYEEYNPPRPVPYLTLLEVYREKME